MPRYLVFTLFILTELAYAEHSRVVLPTPAIMEVTDERLQLGSIRVTTALPSSLHSNIRANLENNFQNLGLSLTYGTSGEANTEIIFANTNHVKAIALLKNHLSAFDVNKIGNEGYFITFEKAGGNKIYLVADSARGRFYALQSLLQLIEKQQRTVRVVHIFDRPGLQRRGVVHGAWAWKKSAIIDEMVQRAAATKINTIWTQGSGINRKFGTPTDKTGQGGKALWRVPFTTSELETIGRYHHMARSNFIDVIMAVSPTVSPENKKMDVVYSSSAHSDDLGYKLKQLYSAGQRTFAVSYDDFRKRGMQGFLRHPDDIEMFGSDSWNGGKEDYAKAQAYFARKIFEPVRELANSEGEAVRFYVLTTYYHDFWYLKEKFPAEYTQYKQKPGDVSLYSYEKYHPTLRDSLPSWIDIMTAPLGTASPVSNAPDGFKRIEENFNTALGTYGKNLIWDRPC